MKDQQLPAEPVDADDAQQHRQRLQKLSRLMDTSIRLPGGYRIGWDGIIGLVPGIGDVVGMGISSYIVLGAARAGASKLTLVRMILNVAIESVVGAVPILGDIFDLVFKANSRNMTLLEKQLQAPEETSRGSRIELIVMAVIVGLLLLLVLWIVVRVLGALFSSIF